MKKNVKKNVYNYNKFFPVILILATLFMGIGYAAVNSITLFIDGNTTALFQDGIFITDINYKSNVNANLEESKIINTYKSSINSSIVLSDTDVNSSITYEITIYNNYDKDYMFVGSFFEDDFYNNGNITFEISKLKLEDIISPGQYLTFEVTFKYKSGVTPNSNINKLDSFIEYRFEPLEIKETLSGIEFNYLIKNGVYAPEGDVYDYYSVDENRLRDESVKIIVFGKSSEYTSEVSGLVKEPIDLYRTGSISLYRKVLSDGTYKIYILSDSGKFKLNENSAWMFDKLYILEEIVNLHLLDTSNVTNMRDMFCDCAKLKNVDLSNFDTSKVTNMIGMFARMTVIEYLDLSTFDTSNVTEIGQMFTTDTSLKKIYVSDKWDVSKKVLAEDGINLFTSCTKLVGGNGTVYDSTKISFEMATIDGANPGYLTNGYKLNTGLQVNHVMKNKSSAEIDAWVIDTRYADTSIKTITFGQTKNYYNIASSYTGVAVDSDGSGVIKVYRVPNGSYYDIYILNNNGNFVANEDSSWLFDKFIMLEKINNLSFLNTSKVVNMRDMFCDVQSIKALDLSGFNTSNVTSIEGMFARMYSIEVLDLSSFNTKNVTNMKNAFVLSISSTETHDSFKTAVPALKTIYVSSLWTNANALATDAAFANNVNLVGGNGTLFSESNVLVSYARVDSSNSPGYFTLK